MVQVECGLVERDALGSGFISREVKMAPADLNCTFCLVCVKNERLLFWRYDLAAIHFPDE
jgi:hypothetical protein